MKFISTMVEVADLLKQMKAITAKQEDVVMQQNHFDELFEANNKLIVCFILAQLMILLEQR